MLGAELQVIGQWLRVIDPAAGEPLPVPEEVEEALQRETAARKAAEEREQQEAAARKAAEERREATEAALRAAMEELARLRGEDTPGA